MKVLVINPIMYTSETKNIKRAASIKDTMMYDFCLAFHEMGHSVTLVGGEPFKPTKSETYPFEVLWWSASAKSLHAALLAVYARDVLVCKTTSYRVRFDYYKRSILTEFIDGISSCTGQDDYLA